MANRKIVTFQELYDKLEEIDSTFITGFDTRSRGVTRSRLIELVNNNTTYVAIRWINSVASNKLVKWEDFYLESFAVVTHQDIFIDLHEDSYGHLYAGKSGVSNNFLDLDVKLDGQGTDDWIKFGKGGKVKIDLNFSYVPGSGSGNSNFDFQVYKVNSSLNDRPINRSLLASRNYMRYQNITELVGTPAPIPVQIGEGLQIYFSKTTSKSHRYSSSFYDIKITKVDEL